MHHVRSVEAGILEHHPEEVRPVLVRLVGDEHRALLGHPLLDAGRNPIQPLPEVPFVLPAPQTRRYVPEAHVRVFRPLEHQPEALPLADALQEEGRVLEHPIDVPFQSGRALRLPHHPELEDVRPATALDVLVADVVDGVVELVLLEEVGGVGGVRSREDALVAQQQRGTLLWGCEELVGVPGHRVGPEERRRKKSPRVNNVFARGLLDRF